MKAGLHVIIGLGVTGFSCARFLNANHIPFAIMDTRPNPPQLEQFQAEFPDAPFVLGALDAGMLASAEVVVVSPGLDPKNPMLISSMQNSKAEIIGDVELFARHVTKPVIAITGTNAKSTVTTLVGLMAKAAGLKVGVGGNLGVPALDLLMQQPDADIYVLELSSFQLETTYSLKPEVASILNISPDHMDRHGTLENYKNAKQRIYHRAKVAVCNKDDKMTWVADNQAESVCYFTLGVPDQNEFGLIEQEYAVYLAKHKQKILPVSSLPIVGRHYQANALAALAIGSAAGFQLEAMLTVLREFTGLPHRCQFVRKLKDVSWFNDSKGTNVGATEAAIAGLGESINGKIVLIAGGVGKNADFSGLVAPVNKYVSRVILIGEAANEIAQAINGVVPVSMADDMSDAIQQAAASVNPDDCVLLSPACASFDMFNNYAHRGEVFTGLVNKLS